MNPPELHPPPIYYHSQPPLIDQPRGRRPHVHPTPPSHLPKPQSHAFSLPQDVQNSGQLPGVQRRSRSSPRNWRDSPSVVPPPPLPDPPNHSQPFIPFPMAETFPPQLPPKVSSAKLRSRSTSPPVRLRRGDRVSPVPPLPPKIPLYSPALPPQPLYHSLHPLIPPHEPSRAPSPVPSPLLPAKLLPIPPQPTDSSPQTPTPEFAEEEELALALALSVKESQERRSKLDEQEDEDLARAMQESLFQLESRRGKSSGQELGVIHSSQQLSDSPMLMSLPEIAGIQPSLMPSQASQILKDGVLARRLAAEDESSQTTRPRLQPYSSYPQGSNHLPSVRHHPPRSTSHPLHSATVLVRKSHHPAVNNATDANLPFLAIPSSRSSEPSSPSASQEQHGFLAVSPVSPSSGSQHAAASPASERSVSLISSPTSDIEEDEESLTSPASNKFVDHALLNGVSFGCTAPQITSTPTILVGRIPSTISLQRGKGPYYIQAPSWRHMLKLMARLSVTRIEASIETIAASKDDFILRTVVQFIKVHHASTEWRMILYLTIDSPLPTGTPTSKSANNDVNTLPWSYTQSPLPTLLRDGADSPLSKFYTIPTTSATPYPSLPITLPNMAMYLNSAMGDSRHAADGLSGTRRLAKMVDQFYPNEQEPGMEDLEPEKLGVGRKFKNMFSRGKHSRRNEDTWDLVTPFVPEYG